MMTWAQITKHAEAKINLPPASDSCHIHEVTELPGSHEFGSHFLEAMAGDPDPKAKDRNVVWGLTADLSSRVPAQDRVLYISKSTDNGKTWTQVARVGAAYFDADIGEGERNGLAVSPGGTEFVITTQKGAFQILPQSGKSDAVVKSIHGDHPKSERRSHHRRRGQDNTQWKGDGGQLRLL